jgi:DNA adenine methylase
MAAKPFLKWAGGKTQLLPNLLGHMPRTIRTYYEPFLGGGALFYALAAEKRFSSACLNDSNAELMNAYVVVRDRVDELIGRLGSLVVNRDVFEQLRANIPADSIGRAARTIYLNKTCFNGLFRVNSQGVFNTSFGKWVSTPKVLDETNLRACSDALRTCSIQSTDFQIVEGALPGDTVYFDPPYLPLSATSNFTGYTMKGFGIPDHERLAALAKVLVAKGVFVVVSNSDTELTRKLYSGGAFEIREVQSRRSINSKKTSRGPIGELIIVSR